MILPHDRASLPNGHNLKDSLESHTSINTSAHNSNFDVDAHDFAPVTNGVSHQDSNLDEAQMSFEPSSDLPNSGPTLDNSLLASSSQSAPDDVTDFSAIKLDEAPLDTTPAVVEQPTSNLREEIQPASTEKTAEIKEVKHQEDLENVPDLANGIRSETAHPETMAVDSQANAATPEPFQETNADSFVSSAPIEKLDPAPSDFANSTPSLQPALIPTAEVANHPPVPMPDGAVAEAPLDPAPSPKNSDHAPVNQPEHETATDQTMQDAPASPSKVAREREDDDLEEGPAAKRSKTEMDLSSDFKVPERPIINTQVNGEQSEEATNEASSITLAQFRALARAVSNVKRIQASIAFRLPVDVVALKIPTYFNYVTKPMDLKTLEENLKAGKYSTVDTFRADFDQIIENSRIFNGAEHSITRAALDMKTHFDKSMDKIPGPDVVESSPAENKKKSIIPPAAKNPAPRRESRSSLPGTARSPASTVSPQTFALNPSGIPSIRRDSTLADGGRPKREIHPPAPRDLPYANSKPKKKKYMYELKFCEKVLSEIGKPKYTRLAFAFMQPVDPVALNIPSYHSIIKKPMDFGTVKNKLDHGEYENAKEFETDARQVFLNCYKFNRDGDAVYKCGQELEGIFDGEWAKKRDWIEANTPASGAQSPGSSDAEDSDDDEEEEEDEDEEATQLVKLQQQIAQMSRQVEMITQKKKTPPVANKKSAKGTKAPRKDIKKAAPAKAEKKQAPKPVKKAPYVSYEQKQDISNRINALSETKMATALNIIRSSMPNLKVSLLPETSPMHIQ